MLAHDMMKDYPPSLAASEVMGTVPENFAFYCFEWLGDNPKHMSVMKCTGAVFREAKTGKNKGKLSVKLDETQVDIYITGEQIKAAVKKLGLE